MAKPPEESPAAKLVRRARSQQAGLPPVLGGVVPAARAATVAWWSDEIDAGLDAPAVRWVACPDLRSQEALSIELPAWGRPALFFLRCREDLMPGSLPDPEEQAERLAVLDAVARATAADPITVLIEAVSLTEEVPPPDAVESARRHLARGQRLEPAQLQAQLEEIGYERVAQVAERGQYALRGGIVDLFPWQAALPLRLEFFDDELESLREFDPDSQVSWRQVDEIDVLLDLPGGAGWHPADGVSPDPAAPTITLADWTRRPGQVVLAIDCPDLDDAFHLSQEDTRAASTLFESLPDPLGRFEAGDFLLQAARREHIADQLRRWRADDWDILLFSPTRGEQKRLLELDESLDLDLGDLSLCLGPVQHGFTLPNLKVAVLASAELFGRYQGRAARRRFARDDELARQTRKVGARELKVGEFVVHVDYGVALFRGISKAPEGEVLVLEYAGEARLRVPISQAHLVSRYVGLGKKRPEFSKLGEAGWRRTVRKTGEAVMDYAAHLLETQARRQTLTGFAHAADNRWQQEFEASFPFRETADQLRSIAQVKKDMEREQPMDRLLCGDVGFGKTEVALRAAFKAVMSGTQVAILCPTTVLAQQHWQTFRQRLSDYPIRVDLLNRFRSPRQQRETLDALAAGEVDIVIGTHRLLSRDVAWKDLGLAVVDEEQRFGVKHKERFKEIFRLVDLLTLSATPIPRTLYQGLVGVRDMSTLETPPLHRHSVQTHVSAYDETLIAQAIARELERDGQVFFLHNRVDSIELVARRIRELAPDARVIVGHGQMEQNQLEEVMQTFLDGQADILVSTTIIETGIDIPNANTIFIDRADRFGLADLYQLRGRVGRAHHQGYAYLLLPQDLINTEAKKRVAAIRQYSQLGDGLRIAMRDLEIRGAGNLLGTQQSGHIVQVGFELYCQLLRQSIDKLQGRTSATHTQVVFQADFLVFGEASLRDESSVDRAQSTAADVCGKVALDGLLSGDHGLETDAAGVHRACLPAAWIRESLVRMRGYRELAEVATQKELDLLRRSWRDRFGPFPPQVEHLLAATEIKLRAARAGIDLVKIDSHKLKLRRNGEFIQPGGRFPRLSGMDPRDVLASANELLKQL